MACIAIELDGAHIATIDLTGLDIVDVFVHGALDREMKAALTAMGGNYRDGGCGHLLWLDERPLLAGQVLKVSLLAQCGAPDRGRSMQELYPDEDPPAGMDLTIDAETQAEMRARPQLHDAFAVCASTSRGLQAAVASDLRNTGYTFRVFWDFTRPQATRVHLTTHCLDHVLAKELGPDHLEGELAPGEYATFSLVS